MAPRWHAFPPLLAILLLVIPLAACAGGNASDDGPSGPDGQADPAAGCGACEQEVASVRAAVERVAGVTEIRDLHYRPDDLNDGSAVVAALTIDSEHGDEIADEVARIGWRSQIPELDGVDVTMKTPSGEILKPLPYNFYDGRDHDHYAERWGPRPDGASGS